MDTTLDCWHRRTSLIELDKLLAARKVTFKPLQSHVTDTIYFFYFFFFLVLQFGKKICRKLWKDLGRHQSFRVGRLQKQYYLPNK